MSGTATATVVLLADGTVGEVGTDALPPIEDAPGSYVRERA